VEHGRERSGHMAFEAFDTTTIGLAIVSPARYSNCGPSLKGRKHTWSGGELE
jgi:hypothetical protein